jgi:integrase
LCFDDVDFVNGVIHIRHNWQDGEGLKSPKYGSFRDVLLPSILEPLFARVSGSGGFVFAPAGFDRPVSGTAIRAWFYDMLGLAGIDKTKRLARNITFHSTRHTFITLGRHDMEINDIDMQAFAGHKRGAMTAHYTHPKQVVNMPEAREKLESFIGGARRADVHGRQSANDLFFLRKNAKNCLTNKKRRRYPVYRQR